MKSNTPGRAPHLGDASDDAWAELQQRRERERRRRFARRPKPISGVLAKVVQRRGYGRLLATGQLNGVWRQAVGEPFARFTRPAGIRGGKLEVIVASSVIRQEIEYRRSELLARLGELAPELQIRGLRFRVGTVP